MKKRFRISAIQIRTTKYYCSARNIMQEGKAKHKKEYQSENTNSSNQCQRSKSVRHRLAIPAKLLFVQVRVRTFCRFHPSSVGSFIFRFRDRSIMWSTSTYSICLQGGLWWQYWSFATVQYIMSLPCLPLCNLSQKLAEVSRCSSTS